ncbi:MAG TPA: MucR family transcriptional regulator [Caulobacteraceae bacterium]|nr:MucR family transcriptional regulator [Caulobacteraceae bacterium]
MDDEGEVRRTAAIVAAYVANNATSTTDLPALISEVHKALRTVVGKGAPEPEPPKAPAVPIRRSIQPDHIVCLEDGRKFKSLRRHLRTKYNLSPEAYRAKWGLPRDYPMVAPNYAEARSKIAKAMGLGQGGRKLVTAAPAVSKPARKRAPRARAPAGA